MKKRILFLALITVFVAGMSAYVLADFGEDDDGNTVYGTIIDDVPGGSSCICPMIWAPVVCRKELPDGTVIKKAFSNGCVAGCHGWFDCNRIVVSR